MKISKSKILSMVRQNLYEAPMDFDTPDRPSPEVIQGLRTGETPFKKVPFPATGQEPAKNFSEVLASKRYREVLQNLRRYTGLNPTIEGESGLGPYGAAMQQAHEEILQLESAHKPELEKLAIELVCKENGLGLDGIQFEPHQESGGTLGKTRELQFIAKIEHDNITPPQNQDDEEEQEQEEEIFHEVENLNLEKAKRRLINAMMQGAALKGHYLYREVPQRLVQITGNADLFNKYAVLMSVNDSFYWQLGTSKIQRATGEDAAGKTWTDRNTEPPTVYAMGKNLAALIHELIKGTVEMVAYAADVDNPEQQQQIEASEDTYKKEIWDIRLGAPIWDAIYESFPEEVREEVNLRQTKLFILHSLFKLPAREFTVLLMELLRGTDRGNQLMSNLIEGVRRKMSEEDAEEEMERMREDLEDASDGISDEDLNDFLSDLGIGPPPEY